MLRRYLLILPFLACIGAAHAGPYSDDMAKCLVASTSPQDKVELIQWIVSSIALHPKVTPLTKVTPDEREKINRHMAALVQRLLTETCRKQSAAAIKYEGALAFQQSFEILGRVAMQDLMGNKEVSDGISGFAKYLDEDKMKALGSSGSTPEEHDE
jgi:hypothetical protein